MRNAPFASSLAVLMLFMLVAFYIAHFYTLSVTGQSMGFDTSPFSSVPYAVRWYESYPNYFVRWIFLLSGGLGISFIVFGVLFHRLRANRPVKDMPVSYTHLTLPTILLV